MGMMKDQDQKVKVVKEKVKETGVMMKTGKVNGKNQKVKVTGETGKTKKKVTGRNLKVKAKVKAAKAAKAAKEVRKVERKEEKETMKTPSITSKKVLNTISRKEKVMEKTPNTTLKEKVVEKVKVTGDPKKTGKENPKEQKNTT